MPLPGVWGILCCTAGLQKVCVIRCRFRDQQGVLSFRFWVAYKIKGRCVPFLITGWMMPAYASFPKVVVL